MSMRGLDSRVALVTGAGSGIGRATAIRLAQEGCRVVCADVIADSAEQTATGSQGYALTVDVSDYAAVVDGLQRAERAVGPIELVACCAGWDRIERFTESTPETWTRVIGVNLYGTVHCVHAVLAGMVERQRGAIVGVSSDAGRVGGVGEVIYSGAKAGVIGFLKAVAREVARDGVRVNTVSPGPTDTPMMASTNHANPRLADALIRAIPFRRLGEPAEVAAAIAFLLSEEATYITGQTLSVNGGLSMI
jgi:2-hydroxycyclohexanecarboxyl-CoA dehydrogenase